MTTRFDSLPASLRERARPLDLAGVPSLLVLPEADDPVPLILWMHGRTVDKELDPGRYQRWMRAGIAACAIDLPGHGQRAEPGRQQPAESLGVIAQALPEIDRILNTLLANFPGRIDPARLGIGGMSLGGMITLRRLCDPHPFAAAAVESTTGWLRELYHPTLPAPTDRVGPIAHDPGALAPVDPINHLGTFRPIPLLVLHSEADQMVPWNGQHAFIDRLRARYQQAGSDPKLIEVQTWPTTGAPMEHAGFGRVAAQAKDLQTAFFQRCFGLA